MIFTFGDGLIFGALIALCFVVMKTGDRIVEAIRARGQE